MSGLNTYSNNTLYDLSLINTSSISATFYKEPTQQVDLSPFYGLIMTSTAIYNTLFPAPPLFISLPEIELTKMSMSFASQILKEDWENESDEFWASL